MRKTSDDAIRKRGGYAGNDTRKLVGLAERLISATKDEPIVVEIGPTHHVEYYNNGSELICRETWMGRTAETSVDAAVKETDWEHLVRFFGKPCKN